MSQSSSKRVGRIMRDGRVWVEHVFVAATTGARMRGLLGLPQLAPDYGLLIERCGAVHTIGMRYGLDLIFFDRQWRITRTVMGVAPGQCWIWGGWRAVRVLEVAVGWLDMTGVTAGAVVEWRDRSTGV